MRSILDLVARPIPRTSAATSAVLSELRGIHTSLNGVCKVLEELLTATQANGRVLRDLSDNQPKYGRRNGD